MGTKMQGMKKDYQKMYDEISLYEGCKDNYDKAYLYSIGYSLSDAPYHGWTGESLQNERDIYKNVESKYQEFKKALENAIGIK